MFKITTDLDQEVMGATYNRGFPGNRLLEKMEEKSSPTSRGSAPDPSILTVCIYLYLVFHNQFPARITNIYLKA